MSSPSPQRPRIALIGITGYAEIYVDLLLEEPNALRCDLTAAAVIPPHQDHPTVARLQARGVRIYPSFDALIEAENGNLDLCIIPTGIHWHARMTIAALEAGAHVLVEKPLAGSLEDAEAMIATAARCGRWIAVGFQDIYAEEYFALRRRLQAGVIGAIRSVEVIGLWPRSGAYYNRNQWAGRLVLEGAAALDSPLNNAFAHFVNLAFNLAEKTGFAGRGIRIEAAELYRAHQIESFDTAVVKAGNEEGVEFWFGLSHACDVYREPEIHITGETGTAAWLHGRHAVIAPEGAPTEHPPVPSYETARQRMFDAVLARLADDTFPICGTAIALRHTRFIHELHRSHTIQTVPAQAIAMRRIPGHANKIPSIVGLDQLLETARSRRALLSEVGFLSELPSSP